LLIKIYKKMFLLQFDFRQSTLSFLVVTASVLYQEVYTFFLVVSASVRYRAASIHSVLES
jgi:hypothetical protein